MTSDAIGRMTLAGDAHDDALVAACHPPGWTNPVPAQRYNLVVLGGGTAGLVAAAGAAGLGAKVALVERHLMGGDCLVTGCVPSKALLASARAAAAARDAPRLGVRTGEVRVDFDAVMARMRRLRAGIAPHDGARRFADLGVDVFLGEGRFTASDAVEVGGVTLRFRKALVATGARAAAPPIEGLSDVPYLTNETLFTLGALPPTLLVLGGGPVGCEMAQAFARFGSRVVLLQAHERVLPRDDARAAALVADALRRDGVELMTSAEVVRAERDGGRVALHVVRAGAQEVVRGDALLVAAGRAPNVEGIGLEAAGVRFDPARGVEVDERLRTSNPRVFAAGDVAGRWQFTHAADFMARLVLRNALFLGRGRASALIVPWCTYTDPELAQIGLTREQADARGVAVDVHEQPLSGVDRAVLDEADEGFVQVLTARGTDRIVGATLVGAHAGDLVGELSLAMTAGVGLGRIAAAIHPYPTTADAIRRLGDRYARTRLTPRVAGIFRRWLAWTR